MNADLQEFSEVLDPLGNVDPESLANAFSQLASLASRAIDESCGGDDLLFCLEKTARHYERILDSFADHRRRLSRCAGSEVLK